MKRFSVIITMFLVLLGTSVLFYSNAKADTCGGRCTGSASCSACKNCSGCKHCNEGGGTCGVCSSSSASTYNTPKVKSTKSNTTYSSSTKTKASIKTYIVKSTILNIRKEPFMNAKIICVVKKAQKIKILKDHNSGWYLVEATCDGTKVKGFTTKATIVE